jgi:hydrogenase maturation protease
MIDAPRSGTVVIGLGNPLMGDDGLGIAVIAQLQQDWQFDPPVEIVDGGTWGMNLLHHIEGARQLLLVDAMKSGKTPGTLVVLQRDEIPRVLSTKLSPHQIDLREVLAVAELRGSLPDPTVAVGLEADRVEMSTELSPILQDGVASLIDRIIRVLEQWGHRADRSDV